MLSTFCGSRCGGVSSVDCPVVGNCSNSRSESSESSEISSGTGRGCLRLLFLGF